MNLKIAICDDEDKALRDIYKKLTKIDSSLVIDTFYSGKKCLPQRKNTILFFLI